MRPLRRDLDLGAEVVRALLPHREPLLLVDRIVGLRTGAEPAIAAEKRVRPDEPVFAGHLPGFPMWPGVYTIEALAQTTLLLFRAMELAELGIDLRNLPAAPPEGVGERLGVLSAVEVKLLRPVFGDTTLTLEAWPEGAWADGWRVGVRASANRSLVAEGRLGLAVRARP